MKIWGIILGFIFLLGTPAAASADHLPISGGITADGQEFFMTGSAHPYDPNMTGLAYYLLPGTATQAEPHSVQLLDWKALTSHISCQGPPAVCLISATSWHLLAVWMASGRPCRISPAPLART